MSLVDVLASLGILGVLAVGGITSLSRFTDRARVESAASTIQNAYRRAQSAARALGAPAELVVSPDSIVLRSVAATDSTILRLPGPALAGVSLSPVLHVASFGVSGLGTGVANVSHLLQRGSIRRQVVVSRLGRVRITP